MRAEGFEWGNFVVNLCSIDDYNLGCHSFYRVAAFGMYFKSRLYAGSIGKIIP